MKKIGLYFGTFNPVHIGHLTIANHMAEHSDLDQIWMVVTPHNPFKKKASLLDNYDRLEMVHIATKDFDKIRPCDIEFGLPQPNYTVNTLAHLKEKYPNYSFSLIMGEDNVKGLKKWKNHEVILEHHAIYVYPRISEKSLALDLKEHPNIHFIKAPIMEISATFIRENIKQKKNITPLLPAGVWQYIDKMHFYH